jgi:hypothetical protein
MKSKVLSFFLVFLFTASLGFGRSIYDGILLFIDDFRGLENEEKILADQKPQVLLRSWYRWGEPPEEKAYSKRTTAIQSLARRGIRLGGGISLSQLNSRDLISPDFQKDWLAQGLDGADFQKNGSCFGTLSSPGFRKYLITKALEQVKLGVKEIHLGETTGEIHFDDWTIGLKGSEGFIQWLRQRYFDKGDKWWEERFGDFGRLIFRREQISREDFLRFKEKKSEAFAKEWGKEGSWHGENSMGETAFLADLYRSNLDAFLTELRETLSQNGFSEITIDVWGFSEWIRRLKQKPDAIIEGFPGREWGLKWMEDTSFSVEENQERIEQIMREVVEKMQPVPVIWAIDHPEPFNSFKKLDDKTQAGLWNVFAHIAWSLNSNILLRSYSQDSDCLGLKTRKTLRNLSQEAKTFFHR